MAGQILKYHPSFYEKFNEHSVLIVTKDKDYQSYLVTENYAVSSHNAFCEQLEGCSYHILLASDSKSNILEKLKDKSFKYTKVNEFYFFYMFYMRSTIFKVSGATMTFSVPQPPPSNHTNPGSI